MGNTYSYMETEKETWIVHNLNFNSSIRAANLNKLQNIEDGTDIYLTYTMSKWGKINYQHWFVTNLDHFIEFGSANTNIYDACVVINNINEYKFSLETKKGILCSQMSQDIRNRIYHVLGMSNYSLCLRNSEHVANYIFRGRWVSSQMDSNLYGLLKIFRPHMLDKEIGQVNTFPSSIRPHIFDNKANKNLYPFLKGSYIASRFDYYLDCDEDTYNVLVVGPAGAGKSHLINVFFNKQICESKVSHHSVTREIYFIRGKGNIYDFEHEEFGERNIVVADTIGLCDTEWNDTQIINLIKSRVSANFKKIDAVIIVFSKDRLLPVQVTNIKKILKWLNYEKNYLRINFVCTNADYLNPNQINDLRKEATKIFNMKHSKKIFSHTDEEIPSLLYTCFPSEEGMNDITKEKVIKNWHNLSMLLTMPGASERISFGQSANFCSIL